jgi:hypothetical protein
MWDLLVFFFRPPRLINKDDLVALPGRKKTQTISLAEKTRKEQARF